MSTTFRLAASLCDGHYQRTPPRFFTGELRHPLVPKFHLGTALVNREVSLRANHRLAPLRMTEI